MSPDNLVSTSLRRSNTNNLKSSKEEDQNCGENDRVAATSTTATSFEGDEQQQQQQQDNHNHQNNHNHASTSAVNHEMLLQWGPRKRSRCSRSEGRSMVSAVMDKYHHTAKTTAATTNHVMPPPHPNPNLPSSSSNGSRSASSTRVRPHALLQSKDTSSAFLPSKNRNIVDQMGTHNASPSRNGGVGGTSSRPISRSTVGKRSPSCIDKNDTSKKICTGSGSGSGAIRKVKSDDSLTPSTNGNGNHHHEHQERGGGSGVGVGVGVGVGHGSSAAAIRSPVRDAEKASELVEWPRIYLSLTRKEKEDDFYAMKGTKLPHRPKKRAKAVDRALQYCFPGLWLSDLTRARYEVRERKSAKKQPKRRGLKGLETMESDSE